MGLMMAWGESMVWGQEGHQKQCLVKLGLCFSWLSKGMIAGACGQNNIHQLNKGRLRALNSEIVKIVKVKLISE